MNALEAHINDSIFISLVLLYLTDVYFMAQNMISNFKAFELDFYLQCSIWLFCSLEIFIYCI